MAGPTSDGGMRTPAAELPACCDSKSQQHAHHRAAHCCLIPGAIIPERQRQPLLGADRCDQTSLHCCMSRASCSLLPVFVRVPAWLQCGLSMSQRPALMPIEGPLPPCWMAAALQGAACVDVDRRVHSNASEQMWYVAYNSALLISNSTYI